MACVAEMLYVVTTNMKEGFMARTVVSIEIGLTQTRLLELETGKKIQRVKKAVVFDTPQNAMEEGYIRDTSEFAEQLSEQMRLAGIKTRDIIFTISSNKVISREVTVTALKEKMIKNIVQAESSDYFPMDITDHAISYSIIGQNKEEKQYRLMVYAIPETLLECFYAIANEMKCNILAMDFVGNSMFQWLKRSTLQEVSLVMQMNEVATVVTVIDKGELGVQRTINYGISMLADALAETHCYDEATNQASALKMLQEEAFLTISAEQEELWKKKELARISESRFRRMEKKDDETEDEAAATNEMSVERILSDDEILRRRMDARAEVSEAAKNITGRVRRVIEYFTTNHPDTAVQQIYITGPGASVKGIDEMIAAELDLPVEIYNVTESVVFANSAKEYEERGAEFLSCFGAIVNPLGLRPADAILRERKKNIAMLSATIFIAAAAVIAYLVVDATLDIRYEKKMKAIFEGRIETAESIEQLYAVYLASQESIASMAATDALSFSVAEQLNDIITALERALPSRSLVHSFSITGDSMTINFSTVTKEEAAKVLMQLKTIPYISEVAVAGIVENVDETTNRTEVVFTVNCILQKKPEIVEQGGTTEGTEVQ